MAKVIAYSRLARQQQLNFLKHKSREYREREDYLARSRQLFFQVEAQMRQAELQQLDLFRELADHFKVPLPFPDLGDRLGLQEFFATNPFLLTLKEYFADRLSDEDCYQRITALQAAADNPAAE